MSPVKWKSVIRQEPKNKIAASVLASQVRSLKIMSREKSLSQREKRKPKSQSKSLVVVGAEKRCPLRGGWNIHMTHLGCLHAKLAYLALSLLKALSRKAFRVGTQVGTRVSKSSCKQAISRASEVGIDRT
jgi:hypothetical protein